MLKLNKYLVLKEKRIISPIAILAEAIKFDAVKFRTVPVKIYDLILWLGIDIEIGNLDVSCFIDLNKKPKIILAADIDEKHRRFTLAHALGHLMLHDIGLEYKEPYITDYSKEQWEIEANVFASELMAPKEWISFVNKKYNNPSPEFLSDIFLISQNCIKA